MIQMQGMFVCISRGLAIKLILFIKGMEGEADANNVNQITAGEIHTSSDTQYAIDLAKLTGYLTCCRL